MGLKTIPNRKSPVLCIDDEPSNLMVRKLLLESAGYFVLTASSGKEGLDIFASQKVDAVVVDYSMPDMDGSVVAAQIKKIKPRVPIIMLSAYPGIRESVKEVVDAFVEKGGEPKDLLSRLESLVKLRGHSHVELESEYVFVDASRRFLDCSDGLCNLLGYSRLDLLDKTVEGISYEPENVPALFKGYPQRGALQREHIFKHKCGQPILIQFHSWVFPDGCMAATCEPITDWKEIYRMAMLELDPAMLQRRAEVALLAIHQRLREFEQVPLSEAEEKIALNDAVNALRVLQREFKPAQLACPTRKVI